MEQKGEINIKARLRRTILKSAFQGEVGVKERLKFIKNLIKKVEENANG